MSEFSPNIVQELFYEKWTTTEQSRWLPLTAFYGGVFIPVMIGSSGLGPSLSPLSVKLA